MGYPSVPSFEDLFSTRGGPFRLLLALPCSPATISPARVRAAVVGSQIWKMVRCRPADLLQDDMKMYEQ